MTKMAAMAIYGKNLKKSSSLEPKGQWPWILVCIIWCLSTTKFAQLMTLGWPWPIFWQGQIWSLRLLNGKKVKHWIFQKLLSSMWFETGNRWLKWQEVSVDIKTLSPGGCMLLPRGYIHVLNHEKNCIKSGFKDIFLKLVTNEWSDKMFLLTSKFRPEGVVSPCPGICILFPKLYLKCQIFSYIYS